MEDHSTLDYVREIAECEGFWYAFSSYSDFEDVDDPKFHKMKDDFIIAGQELARYLGLDPLEV